MYIPSESKKLLTFLHNLTTDCSVSIAQRETVARGLREWKYTGSDAGGEPAEYNALEPHIDRLTSYLFSPADLRFHITYEETLPDIQLDQAEVAARYLTAAIRRQDVDLRFQDAVEMGLDFGAGILKLGWGNKGLTSRLIAPYNMGVFREDVNDLDEQEAILEKSYVTEHELWRRIGHMDGAEDLQKRALQKGKKGKAAGGPDASSFISQIIMGGTRPIQPDGDASGNWSPTPSVIPAYVSAEVAAAMIPVYELTILDDNLGDYTTMQWVEPDIIITRGTRRQNLFLPHMHPFVLVQPNRVEGYLWGRPEIVNLIGLQGWLAERVADVRSGMQQQWGRVRSVTGGMENTEELNAVLNRTGWIAPKDPQTKVEDLTPQFPPNAFEELHMIQDYMDVVSGFQNILSGKGEQGVRSGNHAQTLVKTASPRLRDRALLVERQCAHMGDKILQLLQAKVAREFYVGDATNDIETLKKQAFLLSELPEEATVEVDSHSSSPIYEDDHEQKAAFLAKAGAIDGEGLLDMIEVPMRDKLKARLRKREQQQAQLMQQHPELLIEQMKHGGKK